MGNLGDLKAQQLILLAVFVSFVTSVATGITTVSLIEAAPQPVQQVVNRVVERTVERVVPEENPDEEGTPIQKEVVTVVVKEEDLAIGAAESVGKSVARIFSRNSGEFASLGLVAGSHRVVADASAVALEGDYVVEVAGVRATGTVTREADGFALIETVDSAPGFSSTPVGNPSSLKLAQSLIAITGRTSTAVATGALAGLNRSAGEGTAVTSIQASLSGAEIVPGALLANIRGEVVGIWVNDGSAPTLFSTAEAAVGFAAAE
jgi:hypothetical protein